MEQLEQICTQDACLTGAQLNDAVMKAVSGLEGLGIAPGDCVAIMMRNDIPLLVATLAAQHLGVYAVQMNWHAHPDEVGYVLRDCGAKLLIGHCDLLQRAAHTIPSGTKMIAVKPAPAIVEAYRIDPLICDTPAWTYPWDAWMDQQVPTTRASIPPLESIIYTSGTTGNPKGVRRMAASAEQIELTEQMRRVVFGIGSGDRVLVPAPLYHTAPNLFTLRAVREAAFLKLPARFDCETLLADIEQHRITHLYTVPTMFVRLLALPLATRERHDLSSLRCVLHAGGPCPPPVKKAVLEWLGPIVHEYYGSTETGPNTFARGEEWLTRPGTVGRAVPGVEINVRDEDGRVLGPHQVGELLVCNRGYADFTYLNRPDARAELQREEFIATGDMGYYDEEGYFFLCDRKRDLVISGGVNIYPAEVEAVLMGMDGVADAAVFGIPDEDFGEALAAYVEPLEGHTVSVESIRAFLTQRLAKFKQPRLIEIHDRLPREESGKIKKRLLREPYWAAAGRRI